MTVSFAGTAMAQETGPRLLRDDRGKVSGVAGMGTPCDAADSYCHPYSATGVVTRIDRDRKSDTVTAFALKGPSGNVELQNFDDTREGLSRSDQRDFGRWLERGMKVTVTGTTSGAVGGATVDSVVVAN